MIKDKKDITTNSIKKCFDVILNGGKSESRLAARKVRKLLYSSSAYSSSTDKFKDIKSVVNKAPDEYAKISEGWRQENFVTAISVIYYLLGREKQPDFLFSWLFQLLQHPNGVIRYAAVRMFVDKLGPLTAHIRVPDYVQDELISKQFDSILRTLYKSLIGLLSILWQPEYEKYKYIDSLPPSPYKSAQMVLAKLEEYCGEEYFEDIVI